ncbi:MAG: sugar transferase [Bacteroidales bacterium]|nr:sugar transferase [Bacteroidales bacterium]MBN2820721.1 sugar transferase [Bacteroidales bacterium]
MKNYITYLDELGEKRYLRDRQNSPKVYSKGIIEPNDLQKAVLGESDQEVFDWINSHLNLQKYSKSILLSTESKSYVESVDFDNLRAIVNFKQVNKIHNLNNYYKAVNRLLPDAGIYIGKVETNVLRKARFHKSYGKSLGRFLYFLDFVFNRVAPKVSPFDKIYNFVTGQRYHLYSRAEVLGRLVYCGFEIIEFKEVGGMMYYVGMKTSLPSDYAKPSFHPLFKMQRIGKGGKMIGVYKMRTMHPYSEYLQDFVIRLNGYNEVGKPANDFRVTSWGKWMRKLWLDEAPQIINILKGEMKLVGVRPLSRVRFNELPEDVQKARVNHKPGCFPPYVALCMPDEHQNIEAEVIYMKDKEQHPFTTDIKYLYKSVYNILANKIRSA